MTRTGWQKIKIFSMSDAIIGRHGWPTLNPAKPRAGVIRVAELRSTRWPMPGDHHSSNGLPLCGFRNRTAAVPRPSHPQLRQLQPTNRSNGFHGWRIHGPWLEAGRPARKLPDNRGAAAVCREWHSGTERHGSACSAPYRPRTVQWLPRAAPDDGHAKDGSWAPAPPWPDRRQSERPRKQVVEGPLPIVGWRIGPTAGLIAPTMARCYAGKACGIRASSGKAQ